MPVNNNIYQDVGESNIIEQQKVCCIQENGLAFGNFEEIESSPKCFYLDTFDMFYFDKKTFKKISAPYLIFMLCMGNLLFGIFISSVVSNITTNNR